MSLSHGDRLAFSSGTTSEDPYGFRRAVAADWRPTIEANPAFAALLAGPVPVVINTCPGPIGPLGFGAWVDTWLSPRTFSRALGLAVAEGAPVVILGQPCFVADVVARHLRAGRRVPDQGVLVLGGYALPRSLRRWFLARLPGFEIVEAYGVAEVDAACLLGLTGPDGEVRWSPRSADVRVQIDAEGGLSIGLGDGPAVATGDQARITADGTLRITPAAARVAPAVAAELESWDDRAWDRRTGALDLRSWTLVQLREGISPVDPEEVSFHQWADRFGFSWVEKPRWG